MSDNSGKSAPGGERGSELPPSMKGMKGEVPKRERGGGTPWQRRADGGGRRRCSEPRLATLLPRYDDLDPVARAGLDRHVAACPVCGPRWALLLEADRWLAIGEGRSGGRCPDAEELYDFGRGPGYRPLTVARRDEIDAHVARCASCRDFARTLDAPVPVPWTMVPLRGGAGVDEAPGDEDDSEDLEPPLRTAVGVPDPGDWRRQAWLPLVAAAAVIAALIVLRPDTGDRTANERVASGSEGIGSVPFAFPSAPVLRGAEHDALLFPRGPVLCAESGAGTAWPLVFELEPHAEAESYRVLVSRHAGGAFDEGTLVAELTGALPRLDAGHLVLDPGHYTFEARAVVRGLERPLGERDFEIVIDAELTTEWNALEGLAEPERGVRRVMLLHERGYLGDARAFARTLAASPERDAYLASTPGR
jgi:hypothetical protein